MKICALSRLREARSAVKVTWRHHSPLPHCTPVRTPSVSMRFNKGDRLWLASVLQVSRHRHHTSSLACDSNQSINHTSSLACDRSSLCTCTSRISGFLRIQFVHFEQALATFLSTLREVEGDADDDVRHDEHCALQPVGRATLADHRDDEGGEEEHANLEGAKIKIEGLAERNCE